MYEILTAPNNFSLPTYIGSGINNGDTINLIDYDGNTILLSFINVNNGYNWLGNLKNIKDNTSLEVIAVMYRHDGTNYQIILSSHVQNAVSSSPVSDSDLSNIPLLIDQDGAWSDNYLQGILTDPDSAGYSGTFSNYDMWSYVISSDYIITDKWHTQCSSNSDPISFLQLGQYKAILEVADYTVGDTLDISLNADMIVPNLTGTNSIIINGAGNVTVTLDDPRVQSIIPAGGTITSLSAIVITFSEHVPNAGNSGYYTMTLTGVSVTPSYQNRSTLDTTLTGNTEDYLTERIINLCNDPAILRYTPVAGTDVTGDPITRAVSVVLSKPISTPAESDFPVGGAGFLALTDATDADGNGISDGTFSYDAIENNADLTLYGEVASGASEDPVTITLSGISDTEGTALTGQNLIAFTATGTAVSVPHDIVMVLDYSGSMGGYAYIDMGGSTVLEQKLAILENAVEEFVNLKTEFPVTGDNVSLVKFFQSDVQATVDGIDDTNIGGYLNGIPGGMTPLGGALYNAILRQDDYNTANPTSKKAIVVFTDGIQNLDPSIYTTSGTDAWVGNCGSSHSWGYVYWQSNVNPPAAREINADYPVFSIGVGMVNSSMFQEMLQGISNASDGNLDVSLQGNTHFSFDDTQMWPNTNSSFHDFLDTIYYGNSPQIIKKEKGVYNTAAPLPVDFTLNRSVKKLVLSLSWLGNKPLRIVLKKGANEITEAQYNVIKQDAFGMVSVDFTSPPFKDLFPNEADKEGDWQALIVPLNNVSGEVMFNLVIFGDEKYIQPVIEEPVIAPEDTIRPSLDPRYTDLSPNNSYVEIFFTEEVYGNENGAGALDPGDFVLDFSGNGGNATGAAITEVDHSEGALSAVIALNITGTPDGKETIIISPKPGSIFDAAGNAAITEENTGDILLFDKLPPKIESSDLSPDNSVLAIEFSEAVVSNPDGTGSLEAADFTLSFNQNGGTASNASVSGVVHTAGSPFVTVNLTVSGTPDGNEEVRVRCNANSVYDASGNPASPEVNTGIKKLHDLTKPLISSVRLAYDNSRLTLAFSEPVYSNNDGTGALEKSDFDLAFSKNGGNASGASISGVTHTPGSVTAEVALTITGTPDGLETLSLTPKDNSVFDGSGNAALAAAAEEVHLFDKVLPVIKSWSLDSANRSVAIIFSEGVYSGPGGTGDLRPSCFEIKFEQNGGSATGAVISRVIHFVGSDMAELLLNITGVPNGKEVIKIVLKGNSVYDVSGNPAAEGGSTDEMKLNDMSVPVISGSRLTPDNEILVVMFSEGIFAEKESTGALKKSDFQIKFDKNGGTATDAGIAGLVHEPGANFVEITLSVTGIPSGEEYLLVYPRKDSVFDASGNAAEESTNTGKVFLNNQVVQTPESSQTVYTGDPVSFGVSVNEKGQPGSSIYGAEVEIVHPAVPFWKLVQKHRKWIIENMDKPAKDPVFKPVKDIASIIGKKQKEGEEPLTDRIYATMMKNKKIARELAKRNTITMELKPEKQIIKQSSRWSGPLLSERLRIVGSLKDKKSLLSVKDIRDRITLSTRKYKTSFTGLLKRTEIPGEYLITYKIRGAGKESGIYERSRTKFKSVTVRPDPKATVISGSYDEKNNTFMVTITPKDLLGNLFVPGAVHKLTCVLDGHERIPVKNIQGDIDSNFIITIPLKKGEDPRKKRLLIKSEGVVLFDDYLGGIKPASKTSSAGSKTLKSTRKSVKKIPKKK